MGQQQIDGAAGVLAVMALAGEALEHRELIERKSITRSEVDEARVAVAELIETQRRMIEAFGLRNENPGQGHASGELLKGPHQYEVVMDAMAALARIGGAAGGEAYQAGRDLIEARAAVAELIEAVKGERWARENNVPALTLINAVLRTDAALARVQGGAT